MKRRLSQYANHAKGRVRVKVEGTRKLFGGLAARSTRWFIPLCVLLILGGCNQHLRFLPPQGTVAADERTHFLLVVGILIVFVALPIFLFIPWVLWRYRYGARASRYTPGWKANLPLEIF